jgi:hypothetical protein
MCRRFNGSKLEEGSVFVQKRLKITSLQTIQIAKTPVQCIDQRFPKCVPQNLRVPCDNAKGSARYM